MEIVIIVFIVLAVAGFLTVESGPITVTGETMAIAPTTTVQRIAKAIATAEGFYASGSLPQRANNPGDLERGDLGNGTINGKTVYPSASQGWEALYKEVELILDGRSAYYKPTSSISEIAVTYTGSDNASAWAQNVADTLGVDIDTQIGQVA